MSSKWVYYLKVELIHNNIDEKLYGLKVERDFLKGCKKYKVKWKRLINPTALKFNYLKTHTHTKKPH